MLAGVVLTGVSQISAVFPPISPGAYTGEILLNIQAYPSVFARIFEALILLVTYCPNPALCARAKEQCIVQSGAVASILARLQLTRVLVGALAQFPLVVVRALTRECLIIGMARARATILTWIERTTVINGNLTLLSGNMRVTFAGRRIGQALAVASTRLACFFAEIDRLMTGDASPALIAVTFRGFPPLSGGTESIATASLPNAWIIEDFSFTESTSVACEARTDEPTAIGSIVALGTILTIDVITREKGLGMALAAVVAIVTRVAVADSI